MYAAEDLEEKSLWVVKDEGSMADFVDDEDLGVLVVLTRYGAGRERAKWVADVVEIRRRYAELRDDQVPRTYTPTDKLLTDVVERTARDLEQLASDRGLKKVNERDHLQPSSAAAARSAVKDYWPTATVSAQWEVAFEAWPRLGNVDITMGPADQTPVLIELKCGAGTDAAGECVWDATKLAFALQCGSASEAYLLAGAPVADWERPIRGAEFFSAADHDLALLRVLYGDWWRHWENHEDPQPTELPCAFRTDPVHKTQLTVGGTSWELRLAAVSVSDGSRIPWPRLTAPDRPHPG